MSEGRYPRAIPRGEPRVAPPLNKVGRAPVPTKTRLLLGVEIPDLTTGCWEWQRYCHHTDGYAVIRMGSLGNRYAHRVSYEAFIGSIPDGLVIDHLCRNRRCINPEHLEPVTPQENQRRGLGYGLKTHCPHGHPYDDENTCIRSGYRSCRTCEQARDRKKYLRRRVARSDT